MTANRTPSSRLLGRVPFVTGLSALYVLLTLILVLLGWRVWQSAAQFTTDNEWVAHTYKVEGQINAVLARLGTLQTDAFGYAATGESARMARFTAQMPLLDNDLATLNDLLVDNPAQLERARDLAKSIQQQRDLASAIIDKRQSLGRLPDDLGNLGISQVRGLARMMLDEEDKLLVQRRLATEHTASQTRILTSSAVALSILFLIVTYWLVRTSHRRSLRSRDTMREANAQLSEALTRANSVGESMTKLSQFGEMLQSCRTLEELREGLGGSMSDMLPGLGGRLALISPSQNLASIGAHWGQHGLIAESIFPPEDCWALRRGQAYPLAGSNSGFVCKHVHWPNPDQPDATYLCLPLAAQGEMIGVLTYDSERAITVAERRIALTAGEQLALGLANLRLQETLRTQSVRDPLTGLFNRRYLEVSLERELLRASRRGLPLAVLMLDIDHFKRFNDSYGHEAGDALLAQFAEVLRRTVRSEDIACRYGGEEFTVVLLEADANAAVQRAEAVRAAVSDMNVLHHQLQLAHVTVSIGLALYPRDAHSPEDLMRRADAALYAAKKSGRDRVMTAESFATHPAPAAVK